MKEPTITDGLEKLAEALEGVAAALEFIARRLEEHEAVLQAIASGVPVGINDEGYLQPWPN